VSSNSMFSEEILGEEGQGGQEEKGVVKSKAWADDDDDDEQEEEKVLAPEVTYDPQSGHKIVTTFKKNEKGQTVKLITRYKLTVHRSLKSPAIDERKKWKKFGMCAGLPPGPESGITAVSPDDYELLLGPQAKIEVKEEKSVLANIECRICKKKGDHYTPNCPLKDVLRNQKEPEVTIAEPGKPDVYRIPNRRGGDEKAEGSRDRDELPTVRVSNLSEGAFENDLQELFKPFGPLQRVFIAKDKNTGASRGFGFVTFYHREDAAKAISKLDGHGYDHLILHLEWALPSKK